MAKSAGALGTQPAKGRFQGHRCFEVAHLIRIEERCCGTLLVTLPGEEEAERFEDSRATNFIGDVVSCLAVHVHGDTIESSLHETDNCDY